MKTFNQTTTYSCDVCGAEIQAVSHRLGHRVFEGHAGIVISSWKVDGRKYVDCCGPTCAKARASELWGDAVMAAVAKSSP
jgi:hypothetical protein